LLDFGCVWFFHVGNPGLFLFSIDDVESSILYFCFVVFVFCGYFLVVGNVCLVWCSYQYASVFFFDFYEYVGFTLVFVDDAPFYVDDCFCPVLDADFFSDSWYCC